MTAFSIYLRQRESPESANQTRRSAPMSERRILISARAGTTLAKSGQEKLINGMAEGAQGTSDNTGIFVADTTNNTVSVGVGHAYRTAR
jgi:hypothetical protein